MFCPWLCLQNIFTEEIVFASYHAIMLDVEYLLRKMFAFAIGVETQVAYVEGESVKPFFALEKFEDWSMGIDLTSAVCERMFHAPNFQIAVETA